MTQEKKLCHNKEQSTWGHGHKYAGQNHYVKDTDKLKISSNSRMVSMPIYFFSNVIIGDFMNVGVGQNSDTGSRDARVRFECQLFSNSQRQKCHGLPVWRTQTKV